MGKSTMKAEPSRGAHVRKDGTVQVECWCGRSFVWIAVSLVGVSTESCGHEECRS